MPISSVTKSDFKARALEIMRRVEATGEAVVITDRGRPVLRVVPYAGSDEALRAALSGTVLSYEEPTEPVAVGDWEALR